MPQKLIRSFITIVILLAAWMTISATGGWKGPVAQMDMPTGTVQPQATESTPAPLVQGTPTPAGNDLGGNLPSPTWTSIFTGYTPYPNSTYSPMGGMGMSGGSMGSGGMGMGSMDMSGCSMMSGMNMSGGSMSGMDMDDYMIQGMDMTGMTGYVQANSTPLLSNPWLLLGWVLLGLVILAILVGAGIAIAWLIRRSKLTQVP